MAHAPFQKISQSQAAKAPAESLHYMMEDLKKLVSR